MKIIIVSVYLILLSRQTVTEEQVNVIGERGKNITLQCNSPSLNVSTVLYQWKKDGVVVASRNSPDQSEHLSISSNGSLNIRGLQFIDGGQYQCECKPEGFDTWQAHGEILLRVADGPTDLVLKITPATALKNGTLYVKRGSDVVFSCSSESVPSQNLAWMFEGSGSSGAVEKCRGEKTGLGFSISNIQPADQGNYTCISKNTLSMRNETKRQELLVYYVPDRHPECSWKMGDGPSDFVFICSWNESYPLPTLEWHEILKDSVIAKGPTINSTARDTASLEVHVNRFILQDREEVKCVARHISGDENSCSFILQMPYPSGDPMITALEGTAITISCTETSSLPPAKTVWMKKDDTVINSTSKYILSGNKPTYMLTITNVTKDDEGIYKCYSVNPLGERELEVVLTVKTTPGNGGAVIGVFVSVLIIMIGIVVGVTAYTKRDRICIGLGFSSLSEDTGDVLSLVDSDEEEIFHDAVPRLPPLTNGHATTLVEIHKIPSNEETADTEQTHPDQTEP